MKVWKTPKGEWITAKEFGQRWKKGIESVTPLEQTRSQLVFTFITVIGLVCGLIVSIIAIKTLWWLGIILLAGLGNTLVGMIGIYQKYLALKRIDMITKIPQEVLDSTTEWMNQ